MSSVELRISGKHEDCLAVVEVLSHSAPIVVHQIRAQSHREPWRVPAWVCIDAEIPSAVRSP